MSKIERIYPTKIHELLELEPYEQFNIRGYDETFYLSQGGMVHEVKENTRNEPVAQLMLSILIQDPFLILRKPNLTIKDKGELKMLEGLCLKGYKWIAEDRYGDVYAYQDKPHKEREEWDTHMPFVYLGHELFVEISKYCNWEDEEPLKIAEILKANGVEV